MARDFKTATQEYIFETVASFAETEFEMSQLTQGLNAPTEAPAPRALAGVGLIISDCLV
jgi:aldehyde dehydrogenase (NAD+)